MKKITTKTWLFIAVIFALFLPIIQQTVPVIKLTELNGYFEKNNYAPFSIETWFSGEYQKNTEKYLNENFGFRNLFVRTYNQIQYSLFNTPKANSVLLGKKNYLYEKAYINAYFGSDFIGNDSIKKKVQKLKEIELALKKSNTDLIIVLAPGKASYYPEYIPESLIEEKKTTNYEVYQKELKQQNLSFVDFNKWFRDMKDTSSYPLFPKTGIHWSNYGETLAADSLIKFVQKKRDTLLPSLKITGINFSNKAKYSDNDIEKGMNLLFPIPIEKMAYPDFEIINKEYKKPKVIVVSDSYYWGMFNWGISDRVFTNGKFWYYNEQIYPDSYETPLKVSNVNIKNELEQVDVVILMSTDANLYKFAFGFIEQAHASIYSGKKVLTKKEERIKDYISAIKATPKWLQSVKEDAEKENIPLDEKIIRMAKYMVWKEEQDEKQ